MFVVRKPPEFVPELASRQLPFGPTHFRNIWDNTNWTQDLGDGWYLVEQD